MMKSKIRGEGKGAAGEAVHTMNIRNFLFFSVDSGRSLAIISTYRRCYYQMIMKMNDQTVAAKDIGGGIVGTLIRFSWRCSAFISGLVALIAGALYWKVRCAQLLCTKFKINVILLHIVQY